MRSLLANQAARSGLVLCLLWLGSAIVLRGTNDFGALIPVLAVASVVLWAPGAGRPFLLGQFVLWAAVIVGATVVLLDSPAMPIMLVLFAVAALWYVVAEPILRSRPT